MILLPLVTAKTQSGGLIAQSVEHRPFKAVVPGSSPGQPTIFLTPSVEKLQSCTF